MFEVRQLACSRGPPPQCALVRYLPGMTQPKGAWVGTAGLPGSRRGAFFLLRPETFKLRLRSAGRDCFEWKVDFCDPDSLGTRLPTGPPV